jgi:hypothetical protein
MWTIRRYLLLEISQEYSRFFNRGDYPAHRMCVCTHGVYAVLKFSTVPVGRPDGVMGF